MTPEKLREKFPNASPDFIRINSQGVYPSKPKRAKGTALVSPVPRETESSVRYEICFTIHSTRPCDFDNWNLKDCLDVLTRIGCIPGDDWRVMQGRIRSRKVHSKEEEKTEIQITIADDQ
jgi:hypothetical protein